MTLLVQLVWPGFRAEGAAQRGRACQLQLSAETGNSSAAQNLDDVL